MKKLLFLLIISCVSFSQDFEIPKFIDFSGIEARLKYEEEERNGVLNEEGEVDVSLEFIGCSLNPKTFK